MHAHEDDGPERGGPYFDLPTWAPLPARPDPDFDRLAAQVATELGVPLVAVVLTSKSGQVFPGAFGMAEPWATQRFMPLSRSVSRRVVHTGAPMVVPDTAADPELAERQFEELVIGAYLAMPLIGGQGRPIGVLGAAHPRPHDWTPAEVALLGRSAVTCSRLLRNRALELAEAEAEAVAVRDDAAARAADVSARAALAHAEEEADRARVVARLSTALLDVGDLADVLRVADRLVRSPLGAALVALGVAESGSADVRVWSTASGSEPLRDPALTLCLSDEHPLAAALRGRGLVVGGALGGELPGGPCSAAVAVPLAMGQHASTGALMVCWRHPREVDGPARSVVTDLALPLGHALDRVLLREQRDRLRGELPA